MAAATQLIPSLEYAALLVPPAMDTKRPMLGLTATTHQNGALGMVVATQLIPSFEYAAEVVL